MRTFETGGVRNDAKGKLDYFGCSSALVRKRYAEFMMKHCEMEDGNKRSSDNWKKGFPPEDTIRSLIRHTEDVALWFEGYGEEMVARCDLEDALCSVIFNASSMLLEAIKERVRRERQAMLDEKKGGYILND